MKKSEIRELAGEALGHLLEAAKATSEEEGDPHVQRALERLSEAAGILPFGQSLQEATLSTADRKALPKSDYAIPEKAPGPGSYPLSDESHARDALARVAQHGTPEEQERVRAAVRKRFPDMKLTESLSLREAVMRDRHGDASEFGLLETVIGPDARDYLEDV